MSSTFDTSLDSFVDPTATSKLNSPTHSQQHININDAVEKIEAKIGVSGSAVPASHTYKITALETLASEVGVGEKIVSKTAAQTLSNKRVVQTITALAPSIGATQNLDLTLGNVFVVTMPAGALTLTVSNELVGQYFSVEIVNATSQGTLTWFSTMKWADGGTAPVLTGTNAKKDIFAFRVTSADNYDGYIVGQNL